ncbi:MAG: hypothetical protein HY927_07445 [Elusimicrobia bacterium]|nr:hypothetical protein [Elusimicrobiota bacterium]
MRRPRGKTGWFLALPLLCAVAVFRAHAAGPDETAELATPSLLETASLKAAVALLESTEAGAPIAAFVRDRAIPLRFANLPEGNHGAFARDGEGRPVIVFSRLGGAELRREPQAAVFLALILAHEGTHARQDLEWDLPDHVENECEAFFSELAVQHELRQRPGVPRSTFEAELRYMQLRSRGGVDRVVEQIREGYDQQVFELAWRQVQGYPEASREKRAARLIKEWRASGSVDRYRPVRELHREAREPARKERLRRTLARWEGVLEGFRAKVAGWPALPAEAPKTSAVKVGQSLRGLDDGTVTWDGAR